jgi:hypothetical protein
MPIQQTTFEVEQAFLQRQFPGFDPAEFEPVIDAIIADLWRLQTPETVNTLAVFEETSFLSTTQIVSILGRATVGVGPLQVQRIDGPDASNPYIWRSADRYLPDGTEDATDGGYWAIVTNGYNVNAASVGFDPAALITETTNLDAFEDWQNYMAYLNDGLVFGSVALRLDFPCETFNFNDTLQLKYRVWLQGNNPGFLGVDGKAMFIIAPNKGGFVINRHNTLGPLYVPGAGWTGADGTVIDGIDIVQDDDSATPYALVPYAFGVWMKGRAKITNCNFIGWGNYSIAVIATSGSADEFEGNANGWEVSNCTVNSSPMHGIFTFGADVNASRLVSGVDVVNCAGAIKDSSFLGNTYIAAQHAGMFAGNLETWNTSPLVHYNGHLYHIKNGNGDSNIAAAQITRPSGTTSDNAAWIYFDDDGPDEFIATWGEVQAANGLIYNVVVGQEANMWTNEPSVSPAVWGVGAAPVEDAYIQYPIAQAMVNKTGLWTGSMFDIGPYTHCGPYQATDANNVCQFINCYTEDGRSLYLSYMRGGAMVVGGRVTLTTESYKPMFGFSGAFGYFRFLSEIIIEYDTTAVGVGGEQGNIAIFLSDDTNFPNAYFLRKHSADPQNIVERYGTGVDDWWRFLSGPLTDYTFNQATPIPFVTQHKLLYLSPGDNRIFSDTAQPSTGSHGRGDICFNSNPATNSILAWRCTASGSPGTWEPLYGINGPSLGNYADDAAAAAGGVVVGQPYRNGSVLMVRVT